MYFFRASSIILAFLSWKVRTPLWPDFRVRDDKKEDEDEHDDTWSVLALWTRDEGTDGPCPSGV